MKTLIIAGALLLSILVLTAIAHNRLGRDYSGRTSFSNAEEKVLFQKKPCSIIYNRYDVDNEIIDFLMIVDAHFRSEFQSAAPQQ